MVGLTGVLELHCLFQATCLALQVQLVLGAWWNVVFLQLRLEAFEVPAACQNVGPPCLSLQLELELQPH